MQQAHEAVNLATKRLQGRPLAGDFAAILTEACSVFTLWQDADRHLHALRSTPMPLLLESAQHAVDIWMWSL